MWNQKINAPGSNVTAADIKNILREIENDPIIRQATVYRPAGSI
jgi:hypothetical protein